MTRDSSLPQVRVVVASFIPRNIYVRLVNELALDLVSCVIE